MGYGTIHSQDHVSSYLTELPKQTLTGKDASGRRVVQTHEQQNQQIFIYMGKSERVGKMMKCKGEDATSWIENTIEPLSTSKLLKEYYVKKCNSQFKNTKVLVSIPEKKVNDFQKLNGKTVALIKKINDPNCSTFKKWYLTIQLKWLVFDGSLAKKLLEHSVEEAARPMIQNESFVMDDEHLNVTENEILLPVQPKTPHDRVQESLNLNGLPDDDEVVIRIETNQSSRSENQSHENQIDSVAEPIQGQSQEVNFVAHFNGRLHKAVKEYNHNMMQSSGLNKTNIDLHKLLITASVREEVENDFQNYLLKFGNPENDIEYAAKAVDFLVEKKESLIHKKAAIVEQAKASDPYVSADTLKQLTTSMDGLLRVLTQCEILYAI